MVYLTQNLISYHYTSKPYAFHTLGTLCIDPMSNMIYLSLSNANAYDGLSNPVTVTRLTTTFQGITYLTGAYSVREHRPIYLLGVF